MMRKAGNAPLDILQENRHQAGLSQQKEPPTRLDPGMVNRSRTIGEALSSGAAILRQGGISEPRQNAEIILASILNKTRARLYLDAGEEFGSGEAISYGHLLGRRLEGEPSQYLAGRVFFHKREFLVKPGVFIPRPETEQLVETILAETTARDYCPILDIGTGTGVIGLSLAAEGRAGVHLLEKDSLAAANARANRKLLGLDSRQARVINDDFFVFARKVPAQSYGLIAANPPYVPSGEKESLAPELSYEPSSALFGGQDGLEFLRRMIIPAARLLKKDGLLFLEIGHAQKKPFLGLLGGTGLEVKKTMFDYRGIERILVCRREPGDFLVDKNGCLEN